MRNQETQQIRVRSGSEQDALWLPRDSVEAHSMNSRASLLLVLGTALMVSGASAQKRGGSNPSVYRNGEFRFSITPPKFGGENLKKTLWLAQFEGPSDGDQGTFLRIGVTQSEFQPFLEEQAKARRVFFSRTVSEKSFKVGKHEAREVVCRCELLTPHMIQLCVFVHAEPLVVSLVATTSESLLSTVEPALRESLGSFQLDE